MKALFVSNDNEEIKLVNNIFRANFSKIQLLSAEKAERALELISFEGPFAAILIECSLKNVDPTQLARTIHENAGERPIIFVGTELMIKDRVDEEFFMNTENAFICKKPLRSDELVEVISESLDWAKKEEFENSVVEIKPDNYLPLKIKNFYLHKESPYDAFMELTPTKFVKVLSKNRPYTQSKIQGLIKKNIKSLYLEKNEHLNFLENTMTKIQVTLKNKKLPPIKIIQTQMAGALIIHQYINNVGISETITKLTEELIETTNYNFSRFDNFKEILSAFPLEHADIPEQSILTSYICEGLTRRLGWSSNLSRKKLGLAAILHDCLLTNEKLVEVQTLDDPDLEEFTIKEQENFKAHAKKAAELATYFSGFTDSEFLIAQHHELPDGNGFPQGLSANKITLLSSVFILSANFATQVAINGANRSAISSIMNLFSNHYNIGNFKGPYKELLALLK